MVPAAVLMPVRAATASLSVRAVSMALTTLSCEPSDFLNAVASAAWSALMVVLFCATFFAAASMVALCVDTVASNVLISPDWVRMLACRVSISACLAA